MQTAIKEQGFLARQIAAQLCGEAAIRAASRAKARDYWRGSETYACNRMLWYGRSGEPITNPFDPASVERMTKGDLIHDHIRNVLIPAIGYRVEEQERQLSAIFPVYRGSEIEPYANVAILGHIDGIITDGEQRFLLEIKTTSDWGFKEVVKTGFRDPDHYSMSYLKQANRYFQMYDPIPPKWVDLDGICLVVYNVNGTPTDDGVPLIDYWFLPDQELFMRDLENLAAIQLSEGVPDRRYYEIGWECIRCSWFSACWPRGRGERRFAAPRFATQARQLDEAFALAQEGTPDEGGGSPAGGDGEVLARGKRSAGRKSRRAKGSVQGDSGDEVDAG